MLKLKKPFLFSVALISATGLTSAVAHAEEIRFCAGPEMQCFAISRADVEQYPGSLLAAMISTAVPATQNVIDAVPHFVVQNVFPATFGTILYWMTSGDPWPLIDSTAVETIVSHARYLKLPLVTAVNAARKQRVCNDLEGYVRVPSDPGDGHHGPTEDFCLMKYLASNDKKLASSRNRAHPWSPISFADAEKACEVLGRGHHLVTNDEWMATARAIERNPLNWNGGVGPVGTGTLSRGYSNIPPGMARAPLMAGDDGEPWFGTGSTDWNHKRTHHLDLGDTNVVWDMAGNLEQYVLDLTARVRWGTAVESIEFTSAAFRDQAHHPSEISRFAPSGPYDSRQNVGRMTIHPFGVAKITRGGSLFSGDGAGIYAADVRAQGQLGEYAVGFRCAYSIPKSFTIRE